MIEFDTILSHQSGYNSSMSPFYTRTGDDGSTSTLGDHRLPKHHPRMETLGTLDEASAALGLARAFSLSAQTASLLVEIQRDLYSLMAEVAATHEIAQRFQILDLPRIQWLESQSNAFEAQVELPHEFILPGDSVSGAALALARTIVRRAERRVSELLDSGELSNYILLQYLNRLSSLCFVLELHENQSAGHGTHLAKGVDTD